MWLKLLLPTVIVVTLWALVGAVIAVQHVEASPSGPHYDLLALFVVAGVGIDLVVSLGVIRWALTPLERFETAVGEARQGQGPVAPATSLIGDDRLDRLIAAFTDLQDTLKHYENISYLARGHACVPAPA